MDFFRNIINNCEYVQAISQQVKNKSDYYCSLSYLLKDNLYPLTHSDKIKLGKGLENVINEGISTKSCWKKLRFNSKSKQIDSIVINNKKRIIICAEYKSNMALDSQKRNVTYTRNMDIYNELKIKYPINKINMYIVNLRFLRRKDIPSFITQR